MNHTNTESKQAWFLHIHKDGSITAHNDTCFQSSEGTVIPVMRASTVHALEVRLKAIADVLGAVDCRCMAVDGPVTETKAEIRSDELLKIYRLAVGSEKEICLRCGEPNPCACEPATQGKVW